MATHYTGHMLRRMAERSITREQVEEVLSSPERCVDDPNEGSVRLERRLPQGTLKVWVVAPWPSGSTVVLKSVAWKD